MTWALIYGCLLGKKIEGTFEVRLVVKGVQTT
jgi:hypothetical protein